MKKNSFIALFFLLLAVSSQASVETSFSDETNESIFRTNNLEDSGARGVYVNTTVPRLGYITMVAKSKPATSDMQTGNLVLYAILDGGITPNVKLSWIAKDVSGNITSGNVTGF